MTDIRISDKFLKRMIHALAVMGVIVAGFYTFSLLKDALIILLNILSPFLTGLLLAYILAPIVLALQHRL
ncbi:MAG: hypothetical protein HC887_12520 [Desulfobacteraceae bacterium]|nr:hypothetical protein [Desulfobacteraceae bacterium]